MRAPPFPPAARDYRAAQEVAASNIIATADTPLQPGDERVVLRMNILATIVGSQTLMAKLNPHDLVDLMGQIEARVTRR